MDSSERPHRTSTSSTSTASDLFICFTSRLSSSSKSSSMKISSKSILSPGRSRDPPVSLSTSLSRRLRTNGSLKGGQSPMFPTGGKKRGSGFENPEPSSPKVTCIGQVRVKTKKQGKKMRTLSRRRSGGGGGEVSFRRIDSSREGANPNLNQGFHPPPPPQECLPHRNQRWVHLPLTICEALRAFGAEFSCLFPCRSSCFSTSDREKEGKHNASDPGQRSCGAVFARWLVALQEGEGGGGRGREIELVVGGEEERERTGFRERTFRRHVGDDIEMFQDEKFVVEDEGRVSICVPPKNALLLMRCRSDPNRVSALANRFTESISPQLEEDEDDLQSEEEDFQEVREELGAAEPIGDTNLAIEPSLSEVLLVSCDAIVEAEREHNPENGEAEQRCSMELEQSLVAEKLEINDEHKVLEEAEQESVAVEANEVGDSALADPEQSIESEEKEGLCTESLEDEELAMRLMLIQDFEDEEVERRTSNLSCSIAPSSHPNSDAEVEEETEKEEALSSPEHHKPEEEETEEVPTIEATLTQETTLNEVDETLTEEKEKSDSEEAEKLEIAERESETKKKSVTERCSGSSSVLPDCLLLMMCEPKLSMEVSKETWVCSTDFIRFLPERPAKNAKTAGGDGKKKRVGAKPGPPPVPTQRAAKQKPPPHIQPGRSSCSLPVTAAKSMANMIEQKLVNAVAYEPFVLTRCKSEPMRTAAAKLAPETCFWNNRKLEPHRRSTLGAAGVGF